MCIVNTVNFIKEYSLIIWVIAFVTGNPVTGYAQLCEGSLGDPVVKLDFGAGTATHAGALPAGTTSYAYSANDFPSDGSYTIENTTAGSGSVWWTTKDHTGNTGGYMMVVNAASLKTDYFYKTTVRGLCSGTTFEFAAWAANLIRTNDVSPPDLTFTILKTDGVSLITTFNTGPIPVTTSNLTWKQYGTQFKMPVGESDVIVQITNNSPGGIPGNDLVLDDITFRPCGPTVSSNFVIGNVGSAVQNACTGNNQSYTLNSTVVNNVYVNPAYKWQVNTGSAWADIAGANTTTYTFNQPTVTGTYQYRMVTAEAANIGSASCQVSSNILTLTVSSAPTADFTVVNSNAKCLQNAVDFKDGSSSPVRISTWSWDFGDGQTSNVQDPSHTYASNGDYDVTLTVVNISGCPSSKTKTIHVNAKLIADFEVTTPSCTTVPVILTDHSSNPEGAIAQWLWSFDDGTPAAIRTTNAPFTHAYTKEGTFTVSLEVISAAGCVSDIVKKTVTITPSPNADFIPPETCSTDATTSFLNTTNVNGSISGLTYQWDFGDSFAGPGNLNTSTLRSPRHAYSRQGTYTATLKVKAANGCTSEIVSKSFTVNGSITSSGFTVTNRNNLCAGAPVEIVNTSTVSFGAFTRITLFYDYDNDQTNNETYYKDPPDNTKKKLPADNKFYHSYPAFNSPLSKNYHVVMVVTAGQTCSIAIHDNINIKALPIVSLSGPAGICQEAAPMQIIENRNGFIGSAVFSGKGVSSQGIFNPAVAGPGTFKLDYLFTSQSGCTYADSISIDVYPTPTVTMPSTTTMLEGTQINITPTTTGDGLTYQWSPTIGVSDPTKLSPVFSPKVDTKYTLTVTTSKGCSASAETTIIVLKTPVAPNTFTPNNDGINDTWNIKYLDTYPTAVVEVFTRNGAKVYSSNNYTVPWDGKYNGTVLPFGVYYYIINTKSGRKPMTGSLTIIK
ncbi:MAG: PKD domain-containing protein [Bacteroidota bacterium]